MLGAERSSEVQLAWPLQRARQTWLIFLRANKFCTKSAAFLYILLSGDATRGIPRFDSLFSFAMFTPKSKVEILIFFVVFFRVISSRDFEI